MIRSMTGYGDAERDTPAGRLRVEIKTVNHRHFNASVRIPQVLERRETEIREWLKSDLTRGRVNYSLRLEAAESESDAVQRLQLDEPRAREYLRVLRALKERLDVPGEVDVALLSGYGDFIVPADEEEIDIPLDDVRAVTREAAQEVITMREQEGRRLRSDLEERLEAIERELEIVADRAPERLVAERDRLRAAVAELAGDVDADEDRLAREIAHLSERWDISEEMVRLRSHVAHFRGLLDGDAGEPVGKRLGFLAQEMLRETNTTGAKANDAPIEHAVVEIKNEIERLREQINNVE